MSMLAKIKPLHWGLLTLLGWGAVVLASGLLRLDDTQHINEGAARALLLVWSVADRVISPIVTLGIPDFRAVLFIPLGLYWPGSIIAAKVFTLLLAFAAAWLLHRWSSRRHGAEAALIATGLLLISPFVLTQVDTLGAGPFLLLMLALGAWMDERYRHNTRPLGGWYFLQLMLIVIALTLHPAALAYPVALAWHWYRQPLDTRQQRHYFIGIALATLFALVIRGGWDLVPWFNNLLTAFADSILTSPGDTSRWLIGALVLVPLLAVLVAERRAIRDDLMTRILALAVLCGALAADGSWVLLCITTLLYLGTQRLILLNQLLGAQNMLGQRGLVLAILLVVTTLFMQSDKAHRTAILVNDIPPDDLLIMTLAQELADLPAEQQILIMSQWPGRTMLAVRRPVVSLPPAYPDAATLQKNTRAATHLIFDPRHPASRALRDQLLEIPDYSHPLSIQPGGVILKLRDDSTAPTRG
ncbi:MAG: hypothetical protein HY940_06915 [Gammaproteobacteria bacterium]|nr:hypothetical protein [Gammaproteobacteria bacterium]